MSSDSTKLPSTWKRPDDLIRLHRLKQKKKQLTARLNNNNNNIRGSEITAADKSQLLEAKLGEKRRNPFTKTTDNAKKIKRDEQSLPSDQDDSLMEFVSRTTTAVTQPPFVRETPTKPEAHKFVLKSFDVKDFSKLLQQANADDDDGILEEQKFSKHLPMDWTIKTRVRLFSRTDLPSTALKTSQLASGLTGFVRCIDTQNCSSGLDISPATRLNQATYYWQHPYLPWITLFPRNSKDNIGIVLGERERKSLVVDWDYSFGGLFQQLRARQCPYFYLCANTFTVLFRAAGTAGRVEIHALMSPTTRGIRSALRQEGIEFSMPLKKDAGLLNKSTEVNGTTIEENNSESVADGKDVNAPEQLDDEDDEDDEWLESLGVDEKEIRKIQTTHARQLKVQEMADDFSDNSLILIEGVECQGFFSFLLNAKSTISNVGRLAGVPPTLLAPVAFPKATMQHLTTRSNKVRMDGVDYSSVEVKGIILPTFLPYVCQLLGETKDTFSATLASSNNTLAFSKATQKLLECPNPADDEHKTDEETAEAVFEQENLSDCGLLPQIVENMCRTGQNAVSLLERVCYDKEYGYAWS